ncbi:hypothetical protein [Methanobacterium bryantii]|uniref:hypothetical protein n=1 Tax=Methanobacterium bryantii TaxID=2161 RepID=UPI0015CD6ACB|nr:hypothetical protein [Methanobacterium bryantii]
MIFWQFLRAMCSTAQKSYGFLEVEGKSLEIFDFGARKIKFFVSSNFPKHSKIEDF